jgi:hypothetical protein
MVLKQRSENYLMLEIHGRIGASRQEPRVQEGRTDMHCGTGITTLTTAVLLISAAGGGLPAQTPNRSDDAANNPACALLSVAEVRKITGREDYERPSVAAAPGEGVAGGSACAYEGAASSLKEPPKIGFVLISGKDYARRHSTTKLPPGDRCKRESVKGVGDVAYFECCPCSAKSAPALFVKVESDDLIVDADVEPPATEASVRSTMTSLAKAVEAKLRNR